MKLTKAQLKRLIKEELTIMTEGHPSGMEVPEEFIRRAERDLQGFKDRYPNVIADFTTSCIPQLHPEASDPL